MYLLSASRYLLPVSSVVGIVRCHPVTCQVPLWEVLTLSALSRKPQMQKPQSRKGSPPQDRNRRTEHRNFIATARYLHAHDNRQHETFLQTSSCPDS